MLKLGMSFRFDLDVNDFFRTQYLRINIGQFQIILLFVRLVDYPIVRIF